MRRFRWFIACLVLLCAACRSAPKPPVKLTIYGLGLQAGEQLRQDALDEFTAKTGIQVDVIPTPGTSSEQLVLTLKLLQRGAVNPDAYLIDVIWPGTLHRHLLDLTPYLNEDARAHVPALLESNIIERRVVSLPFYMNTGMLFYRADLLRKYGFDGPPATWGDLDRMALRIQEGERREGKKQFWGYVWQGAAYEGLTCNALEWQRSFGGGNIIESDGSVTVNNPRTARALDMARSCVKRISPQSVLAYRESDTLNIFQSGGAAFMRYWSSAFPGIAKVLPAGSAGIALLPAGPAGRAQTIGGFHIGVSRYSRYPKEAAALVLYLTGEEVQKRRALRRGYLPTRPRLHSDAELAAALPQLRVLQKAPSESWVSRPSTITQDKYGLVSEAFYRAVHGVLSGETQTRPALAGLEQDLIRLTSGTTSGPD